MNPVLVQIGPLSIRYYGLMYVIAFTVGFFLIAREVRRKHLELSTEDLLDLLLWTVPMAIIGARLYYVAFDWQAFAGDPIRILMIWKGGLAIHGGVLAGAITVLVYARVKRVAFWALTDAMVPSLILGQAIGRIGNLINGDAHGLPTTLPWGIRYPAFTPAGDPIPAGAQFPGAATHPSMIYEMILNLLIFAFLWGVRKRGHKDGFSTGMYLVLYSVARFIVSFTRADSLWLGRLRDVEIAVGSQTFLIQVGTVRAAHVISVILILVFGVWILWKRLYERTTTL